jgi:hypothetical protein
VTTPTPAAGADTKEAEILEDYDEGYDEFGPPTTRGRLPRLTAALLVALLVAGGFVTGAVVQRQFGATATATSPFPSPGSGGFPDFSGGAPSGTSGQAGQGGSGASGTDNVIGTVVSVTGNTVTVKDFGGTTHQIQATGSTDIQHTAPTTLTDLTKGSTVVVTGRTGADGSLSATTITQR